MKLAHYGIQLAIEDRRWTDAADWFAAAVGIRLPPDTDIFFMENSIATSAHLYIGLDEYAWFPDRGVSAFRAGRPSRSLVKIYAK